VFTKSATILTFTAPNKPSLRSLGVDTYSNATPTATVLLSSHIPAGTSARSMGLHSPGAALAFLGSAAAGRVGPYARSPPPPTPLKPPYVRLDISGSPDTSLGVPYYINFLTVSCKGMRGTFEAIAAIKLPNKSAKSVALSLLYRGISMPAQVKCTVTMHCMLNGWKNLQVSLLQGL
jgi:hypothetical protein